MEESQSTLNRKRSELLKEVKEAPTSPGVYLMKDSTGVILYVGKAKHLRNRLTSYFQRIPHEIPRIEFLVQKIERFEVILTETEKEALILECTLIKKHKPHYNIRLKDDKHYPYLKIDLSQAFPKVEWTRKVRRGDKARYFGPFPSSYAARTTLELLIETYKLRDCSDNTFRHRSRPCMLYQIGKCTAPCVGEVTETQYALQIKEVISTLEGKNKKILKMLESEMKEAANEENYEDAAFLRDRLLNLKTVTDIQVVDEAGASRNRDVIGLMIKGVIAQAAILQIRSGKLVSVKHIHLNHVEWGGEGDWNEVDEKSDAHLEKQDFLFQFLSQYYLEEKADTSDAPGEVAFNEPVFEVNERQVLVQFLPADVKLFEEVTGYVLKTPRSENDRQLLNVALTNAKHALTQVEKTFEGHGIKSLEEVKEKCHLDKVPLRIECYDISNFQGMDSVASRVVFTEGAPDKTLYRRYKIKTVEGQNDFAMMREVLERRFSSDEALPDLVVVDGGKGQLSQAVQILKELDLSDIPVVGLAKARTESDFESSEVESSLERIFIPGRKNPVPLHPHMGAYKLLTHIRDEAHRFAINYHRNLRDKRGMGKSS